MSWTYLKEMATEAIVLAGSGLFLAWYVWAKIAVWPWGAWSF
jgi:hypothetical protein